MVAEYIVQYLMIFVSIFLLNVQPVFNLPTWIVLTFFSITNGLPVLAITIIGVAASCTGRYILAVYTGELTNKYLPKKQKENVHFIAEFIGKKTNPIELFVISFLYGLSPLPTNTLFIVAGAAHMRLPFIVSGFFFGELFSNFVYVSAVAVTLNIAQCIVIGVIGIAAALAVLFIDWKKIIHWMIEREKKKHPEEIHGH